MQMTEIQQRLNAAGFPCGAADGKLGPATKAAVSRFQMAANAHPWLAVDGNPGPLTQAALARLPMLSDHFSVAELRSHEPGGACYVRRELLDALERLRAHAGRPLQLRDAYRSPAHNRAVGGVSNSQHLYGLAADTDAANRLTVAFVEGLRIFSGIGDKGGIVLHVDVRHTHPETNTTRSTPVAPARWQYAD